MISFSGYKRYTQCPQFYKYHDVEKYRPGAATSALAVGIICDDLVGQKLSGKPVDNYADSLKMVAEHSATNVEFFPDDLDIDLINIEATVKTARDMGWKGDDIKSALSDMTKDQTNLTANQHKLLSAATWESLHVKIVAMLDSFDKWIAPQISSAENIQHHVVGDGVQGYLDFTCTLKDGRNVLMDLKTSKMPYSKDSVKYSAQLSLYAALMGYDYAGFIVLTKTLNKNKVKSCPDCNYVVNGTNRTKCPTHKTALDVKMQPTSYSQIIVDKVPAHTKQITLKAINDTIEAIDKGIFPRNLNQCSYMYGRPCIYRNKCWNK